MIVIVEERGIVSGGYAASLSREGVSSFAIDPAEFQEWLHELSECDIRAVEAFLIGDSENRAAFPKLIRQRSNAPVLCLNEQTSLDDTLNLFAAGVDDVLRKPIHVREILARVGAINRRAMGDKGQVTFGDLRVHFDGRDPEIDGKPLQLPRRERRILEYIVRNRGRRVNKAQIFNAIYGLFDENVDENVIESHISKLRKKLRQRLGHDPIDSKRFLGYCINLPSVRGLPAVEEKAAALVEA